MHEARLVRSQEPYCAVHHAHHLGLDGLGWGSPSLQAAKKRSRRKQPEHVGGGEETKASFAMARLSKSQAMVVITR